MENRPRSRTVSPVFGLVFSQYVAAHTGYSSPAARVRSRSPFRPGPWHVESSAENGATFGLLPPRHHYRLRAGVMRPCGRLAATTGTAR